MEKLLLVAGVQPRAPSSRPASAISCAQRSRRLRSMGEELMARLQATGRDSCAYYTEAARRPDFTSGSSAIRYRSRGAMRQSGAATCLPARIALS
jgi:hypothetical protein